jgi:hypothetical protein
LGRLATRGVQKRNQKKLQFFSAATKKLQFFSAATKKSTHFSHGAQLVLSALCYLYTCCLPWAVSYMTNFELHTFERAM